jgi:hypothetical protein
MAECVCQQTKSEKQIRDPETTALAAFCEGRMASIPSDSRTVTLSNRASTGFSWNHVRFLGGIGTIAQSTSVTSQKFLQEKCQIQQGWNEISTQCPCHARSSSTPYRFVLESASEPTRRHRCKRRHRDASWDQATQMRRGS